MHAECVPNVISAASGVDLGYLLGSVFESKWCPSPNGIPRAPRPPKELSKRSPRGPKGLPRGPKRLPGRAKRLPGGSKGLSGGSKRRPRGRQEAPREVLRPQGASKRTPRAPKMPRRGLQTLTHVIRQLGCHNSGFQKGFKSVQDPSL